VAQFAKANFTLLERVSQKLMETATETIDAEQGVIPKLEESLRLADQISKYTDEICWYNLFFPFLLLLLLLFNHFIFYINTIA
jgi:hypothetical protein